MAGRDEDTKKLVARSMHFMTRAPETFQQSSSPKERKKSPPKETVKSNVSPPKTTASGGGKTPVGIIGQDLAEDAAIMAPSRRWEQKAKYEPLKKKPQDVSDFVIESDSATITNQCTEIQVSDPQSPGTLISFGMTIKTTSKKITKEHSLNLHNITDIQDNSLADQMKIEKGNIIVEINELPTYHWSHEVLVNQFKIVRPEKFSISISKPTETENIDTPKKPALISRGLGGDDSSKRLFLPSSDDIEEDGDENDDDNDEEWRKGVAALALSTKKVCELVVRPSERDHDQLEGVCVRQMVQALEMRAPVITYPLTHDPLCDEVHLGCGPKAKYGFMRIHKTKKNMKIFPLREDDEEHSYKFRQVIFQVRKSKREPAYIKVWQCYLDDQWYFVTQVSSEEITLQKEKDFKTPIKKIEKADPRFFFQESLSENEYYESTQKDGFFMSVNESLNNITLTNKGQEGVKPKDEHLLFFIHDKGNSP